ncbi:MAG: hypothetical protein IKX77_00535 [Clostridia bacterium]|nr:hypothetical protein [Clostridia bacterium]
MDKEYSVSDEIDIDIENICRRKTREKIGVCAQCGYVVFDDDDAFKINANGEVLHKVCWEEYASQNAGEFLTAI